MIGRTIPSSCRSSAASRWSGVTSGLLSALAVSTARPIASWVFWVQRFGSRAMVLPPLVEHDGLLEGDEVAPVPAMRLLHGLLGAVPGGREGLAEPRQLSLEGQHL